MGSSFGHGIRMQVFGQSHSAAIGVVVDGLPAGEPVDLDRLAAFMARRAPGQGAWATPRKEADAPRVLSGLNDRGRTCGAPLALLLSNTNTRSKDYSQIARNPRPGHADLTAQARWHGEQDVAGGGHFSGRLTACIAMAGAVCLQVLERRGVRVGAHIARVAGIDDAPFDPVALTEDELMAPGAKPFAVVDDEAGLAMQAAIAGARAAGDSVGGVVECAALGLPAGVGSPMFDGLENRIAALAFGIPAVKGVEFGAGFAAADLYGSQNNDPYAVDGEGRARPRTNNAGGILGRHQHRGAPAVPLRLQAHPLHRARAAHGRPARRRRRHPCGGGAPRPLHRAARGAGGRGRLRLRPGRRPGRRRDARPP